MRALLLLPCLLATLSAQSQSFTIPGQMASVNVDRPWPAGIGRYQQWFSAASFQTHLPGPRRIERVEFLAGTSPTSQAAQINCEILMSHGHVFGLFGPFSTNYADSPVVVKPTGNVSLLAGPAGSVVLTVPFLTPFTWDGERPVLLEIRIFGNSLGSQPFAYNFRGAAGQQGMISRVYAPGSAGATTGTVAQGLGMDVRFTARPGSMLSFGSGCPGEGGFVPVGTASEIPWPSILWTHTLSMAASQRICIWVFGNSKTAWESIPLPVDLPILLGYPPSNCMLLTNPIALNLAVTVGGGAGGGIATMPIQLPAVTGYIGQSFYTQWVVLDPLALNGLLSVTAGLHSVVAPLGG
ncbi:MAG TPA: hypothetical protein VFT55_13830 [Planctomycetota bacterium]|nr:hypothetical protein [Planctomycetota bacterium]